jgi:hypothetical protein
MEDESYGNEVQRRVASACDLRWRSSYGGIRTPAWVRWSG